MRENEIISHFLETPNVRTTLYVVFQLTAVKEEVKAAGFEQ